jgi:parallel beta helix pectate lyase-like protein
MRDVAMKDLDTAIITRTDHGYEVTDYFGELAAPKQERIHFSPNSTAWRHSFHHVVLMKKLILLALLNSGVCIGQQMNSQQIKGTVVVQTPPGNQSITQPTGTTLSVSSLNKIINPTLYEGSDIGAQISSAANSAACSAGCTISIPPGTYSQTSGTIVTRPNIRIVGNGAVLTAVGGFTAQITIQADNNEVSGVSFVTASDTYGIIATSGINQRVIGNNFRGAGVTYIAVSGSPSGILVQNNSFNGSDGCAFQNNISIFWSSHATVSNNNATNTCGFAIEVSASKQTDIHNNVILQDTQLRSIVASAGQTNFVFNWPAGLPTISRVWIEVNGVPTMAASTAYTNPTTTTVTMAPQGSGNVVTALGWSGLESIQANSQAFNTIIDGNVVTGTGDAGIDVVSDFHIVNSGTITSSANQSVFVISASPGITTQALPFANGRVLTPDEASITNVGNTYTITLKRPAISETQIMLGDWTLNLPATVFTDYPSGVTIQNNVVKNIAGSCIAAEVGATNIIIQGNVMENCGLGVATPAFSSGIFTGNAIKLAVKNNTIINSRLVPTMNAGISVQCVRCETGAMKKPVLISGNTYKGTFVNGGLYIPGLWTRQSGIDIFDGSTIY